MSIKERLKLAFMHLVHGFIPIAFAESIHSNDDGDPTKKQKELLRLKKEGYSRHLWLNICLAINHLKGIKVKKHAWPRKRQERIPAEFQGMPIRMSKKSRKGQRPR